MEQGWQGPSIFTLFIRVMEIGESRHNMINNAKNSILGNWFPLALVSCNHGSKGFIVALHRDIDKAISL